MQNNTSQNDSTRKNSHDLYKLADGTYTVSSFKLSKPYGGLTVEYAAEALNSLGVPHDEIDYALIDMAQKDSNHAQFGVIHGAFIFSEKVDKIET